MYMADDMRGNNVTTHVMGPFGGPSEVRFGPQVNRRTHVVEKSSGVDGKYELKKRQHRHELGGVDLPTWFCFAGGIVSKDALYVVTVLSHRRWPDKSHFLRIQNLINLKKTRKRDIRT